MNPINRLLLPLGIGLHRVHPPPLDFRQRYRDLLRRVRALDLPFQVQELMFCDAGGHPLSYKEYECGFAASCLAAHAPANILDVGSYREFVLGVSAAYRVTSLDVRAAPQVSGNETVVAGDARQLPFPDNHFDAVTSLSSIEHFGLGRYGDAFDLEGDRKAMEEMRRCLKAGGILVLSTTLTRGKPVLAFNAHRIYSLEMIRSLCLNLAAAREAYFSHRLARFCEFDEISDESGVWDVYCGCWRKTTGAGRSAGQPLTTTR